MKIVCGVSRSSSWKRRNFSFFSLTFFLRSSFIFLFFSSSFAARWVTSGRFRGGARRRVPRKLYDARVRRSGQTSVKSRLSLRLCMTHKGDRAHIFRVCADREYEARSQRFVSIGIPTREGEERKRVEMKLLYATEYSLSTSLGYIAS